MHKVINGFSFVTAYNLYKATKAFQNKQYLDSIYFETFALSLFMRIKFHANKIMEADRHMPTEGNINCFYFLFVRVYIDQILLQRTWRIS